MADKPTNRQVNATDHDLQTPPRTIKPRNRASKVLPVVAIGHTDYLAESGETGTVSQLVQDLPDYPATIFCRLGAADFLAELVSVYTLRTNGTFQWRTTSQEQSISAPSKVMRATRVSTVVHYFGWADEYNRKYHKLIDPVTMYGRSLDQIWPGEVTPVDDAEWRSMVKLLKWGTALRDFCAENNMEVRSTLGSTAVQFLTDPRFYPERRRKVPAKINQRVRENLPGNHYHLNVLPDPSNDFSAHYLDQHRAHHYHAQHTPLPDSNHCFAYGRFADLSGEAFDTVADLFLGLYCVDLLAPRRHLPFSWLGHSLDAQFIYSNELQHLLDLGYRVRAVRAAWGSLKRDTGLPKYATWAQEQLDRFGDPPWLKQFLLATYGTLAIRPVTGQSVFRIAKRGTPVTIRTGRRVLNGLMVQSPRKLEPRIAFVLQRGMIEAACRSESVGLAQWLENEGHRVLSIYADAVMVEADDDKPLPILPDPWRCKRTLNRLQFVNQQAFISDGMTKLPGVGQELREYRQHHKPGYAPRKELYEAVTQQPVRSSRRI